MTLYNDRKDAGKQLAIALREYANQEDVIVLALPRGGVVVAYEVCQALNLPLDVIVVRKLGVPGHQELAFGSISIHDVTVYNDDVLSSYNLSQQAIDRVTAEQRSELHRREQVYRSKRPPLDVTGKRIILVDDGIATGATIRSAIAAIKQLKPAEIIVAIPVAPYSSCEKFQTLVDKIVCLETPYPFYAIGQWYIDFSQTSDEEVVSLMQEAATYYIKQT